MGQRRRPAVLADRRHLPPRHAHDRRARYGYSFASLADMPAEVFIRTFAVNAGTTARVGGLTLNGHAIADAADSGASGLDILRVGGDLSAGLTLAGTATLPWSGAQPANSQLAFQIKVGAATDPVLTSFTVNGGGAQRSMVNRLTVVFDRPMALGSDALELTRRDGTPGELTATTSNPTGDGMTYVLTFSRAAVIGGSLPDGIYDLTVHADRVRDEFGRLLSGGDTTLTFHRLSSDDGDGDGDGDSDNLDLLALRDTLLKASTDPAYKWCFDYDQNGSVDNLDAFQVRGRRDVVYTY